jgi:hypothetical protein
MREKTDETNERVDRWERREHTTRGKTDERGEDNSGEGIQKYKRTERDRRNSAVELIFGMKGPQEF